MSNKTLIVILGWEDRFFKGIEYNFKEFGFNKCYLFCYKEYLGDTKTSLDKMKDFCLANNIYLELSYLENENAIVNWREIEIISKKIVSDVNEILLDISTTPRETLWTLLFFLRVKFRQIKYIYHKPVSYSKWLSREPENPRLLFKHSGLIKFDNPTLLLVFTGYDIERVRQLINFYEPKRTILLVQEGNQFENENRNNIELYTREFKWLSDIDITLSNSYNLNDCYEVIKMKLDKNLTNYNIVATSLGPKISGLALYKYFTENSSIALSYVPCKEYNLKYSSGWGGEVNGILAL